MFIKSLQIIKGNVIIRDIKFKYGLNFIVDETISGNNTTGNSVGKTTVIKLIDFCLGANQKIIYSDDENKKKEYQLVKDFLINNGILIRAVFCESLDSDKAKNIIVERNFLNRKQAIRRINGEEILEKDFSNKLSLELFGIPDLGQPSFNQLIAHNIRHKDIRISNTFKFLDAFASDQDYQFLFLFMFGCPFGRASEKLELSKKLDLELAFKSRLEQKGTKNDFDMLLDTIKKKIKKLEQKKCTNEDYQKYKSLIELKNNNIGMLNKLSTEKSNIALKLEIIEDSLHELENDVFEPDLEDIKLLYEEVKTFIKNIHVTFEQVVDYHSSMLKERKNFILQEKQKLQKLQEDISAQINRIIQDNQTFNDEINKINYRFDADKIQLELSRLYEKKGEYETIISQLDEVDEKVKDIQKDITLVDEELFSEKFQENLHSKIKCFNDYLSKVSKKLYNEEYLVSGNIKTNKKNVKSYEFSIIYSDSYSTGKKQGEVLCFDLAYLQYAKDNNIPALMFLANDKKELLHTNQMLKLNEFLQNKKIQFICSILKDKLPKELDKDENICIRLKQEDKLFRIENMESN